MRLDKIRLTTALFVAAFLAAGGCSDMANVPVSAGIGPEPVLPPPGSSLIPTVNVAPASPWEEGEKPHAAPGTRVQAFARNLSHPRWLYVLPNGDVLVAETNAPPRPEAQGGIKGWFMKKVMKRAGAGVPSADRITLLRDTNGDGEADTRAEFLSNLYSPFGMALVGDDLYVANTDAVLRFSYTRGQTRIDAAGEKVMDLPAGPINYHWTKNIIASPDGSRLYATVGSNSNVGEKGMENEVGRAAIWVLDLDSGEQRLYATGLRNPNGLAFVPPGGELWTAVNERDEIGSDLVPDYITSVEDGGFYGWPYSYYGDHVDERVKPPRPDLVERAIVPDYATGPHTATLGLAWSDGGALAPVFGRGLFLGQHGSWNRKPLSGYKVIFVPFNTGGEPSGNPVDVLTGFLDTGAGEANGRPVGVVVGRRGELLVADDVGNTVWRVSTAAED